MIYAPSEREKSARGTRREKFVLPRSCGGPNRIALMSDHDECEREPGDVREILRRRRYADG